MGPDQLALMIPILALCIPMLAIWTRHRRTIAEMQVRATAELSAEKAAQYAAHTRELEERVRVLERIVTDRGFDTASQIEALRRDSAALADGRAS
ncbi:Phage shock protein B [Novosphingobium lubricantis]|jgi:hypothetical protein